MDTDPTTDAPDSPFGSDLAIDPDAILATVRERLNISDDALDEAADPADIPADDAPDADTDLDPDIDDAPDAPPVDESTDGSEGGAERRPSPPSESPTDPTAPTADTQDEPPAPDPSPDDDWSRAGEYLEQLYGGRPTVDQIVELDRVTREWAPFVQAVNQLPQDQQQLLESMLRGEFDPQTYARSVLPPDDDPFGPDPTPATPDPTAREIQALRADLAAQQRREQMTTGEQQVGAAVQSFLAEHPDLSNRDLAELRQRVHQRGLFAAEVSAGQPITETYLRHLRAEATYAGVGGGSSTPPASAAPPTPTPDTPTAPADPTPPATPDPREDAKAASGAIAGSSTAARPPARRKSVMDGGRDSTPASTPLNPQGAAKAKLTDDILSAISSR